MQMFLNYTDLRMTCVSSVGLWHKEILVPGLLLASAGPLSQHLLKPEVFDRGERTRRI